MEKWKILSVFVALAFLLAPFMGLFMTVDNTVAQEEPEGGTVTETKEGWEELDFGWDANNIGTPYLMNLSLNTGWNMVDAKVGVSGDPVVTDKGTEWETKSYPERVRLDVGRNGDDWEFPGMLGYQDQFANDSDMEEPTFSTDDVKYLYIPIPVGADIDNLEFNVSNTQSGQFEYEMYIGERDRRVWYKSSIGFSTGPVIETEPYGVDQVCVNHLDFLLDSHNDMVGVGDGGSLYIFTYNEESENNYDMNLVSVGQGDPLPALLDCEIGDYDQDLINDIAVSSADGKMYVVKNEGFGAFGSPQMIEAATSRMETVTFGDVNNDDYLDVVGGYLRGEFFVSKFDKNSKSFKDPVELEGGTGAMNEVFVGDIDLDAQNDIVGANNDRNWWFVKNDRGTAWEDAVPIRSGGNDLTSLEVVDVNWDNSPDLISGSQDGSFYVSYNLGGSFDEGVALRGGLETMRDVVAGDLDLDGDIDILGLNADGKIYLVRNEFGYLADGKELMEVGKDINSIALGDLDNDNDLDLIGGSGTGIKIFWNNLGPFEVTVGKNDGGVLKDEVQRFLDTYKPDEEDYDPYGNLIVDVPFKVESTYPGTLLFDQVNVTYDYEATVNITTPLNLYLKANKEKADAKNNLDVPVQFLIDTAGRIHVTSISLTYVEEFTVIIDQPLDDAEFNTSKSITLKGHSNEDPDGTSEDIDYTWMVDGRLLGETATLKVTGDELGGVGTHTLRFTGKNKVTHETDHETIHINLIPPDAPFLNLKIRLPTDKNYVEDEKVNVPITIKNTGAINASQIGIVLLDGKRKADTETVGLISTDEDEDIELFWTPSAGDHKLCTEVVPEETPHKNHCVSVFVQKKEEDYTIFAVLLAMIVVGGVVGYFAIRWKQKHDAEKAEKEKKKLQEQLKAEMQADFADIYTEGGADPYAEYGAEEAYGAGAYDAYGTEGTTVGGVAGYGEVSPEYQTYKCPRCGQPTTDYGVQCFACDAKDSVKFAEEAIKEVKELGVDVDEAEELLRTAKESISSGDYEIALEEAEEAEDIASEVKDRYDQAFAMISEDAAESAAERRRKRLERRRAAREKRDKMKEMGGEEVPEEEGMEEAEGGEEA